MVIFENINEYTAYTEMNVHTQYIESIDNIQNRCMHTERLEERLYEDDQGNANDLGCKLDSSLLKFFFFVFRCGAHLTSQCIVSGYCTVG